MSCCPFNTFCEINCSSNFVGGCTLPAPTPEPTPAPTENVFEAPTPGPTECLVNVSNNECPALMSSQPTEDVDCDCWNFCNGNELSCCKFGEACEVSCMGDLVAGCDLTSPNSSIAPSPSPSASPSNVPTVAFSEAPTNSPSPWPSAVPSSLPSIRPTEAPTPPEEAPEEGMCLIAVSTDKCSPIVQGQSPIEDCDCYNYCDGDFIGCCPYGEFCPVICSGNLVAGCALEPPEPQCLISASTEQCSELTRDQSPVEECDCYNYCDGEFLGCCGHDEFCPMTCSGTLVAGCDLESTSIHTCLLSIATDQCDDRMSNQSPVEECDCYDFCDGKFVGCCKSGEFCGFRCSSLDAVAGCQFNQ